MTTTTAPRATPDHRPAAAIAPIPFGRLARVELRKQVDTRAGRALLGVIVAVNAVLIALMLVVGRPEDLTWQSLTTTASLGQVFLLPLLGVLAATGEWSQRTALTTFALEPRRTRVHLAKLVAAAALGVAVMLATLLVGALANVAGLLWRDGEGGWALEWGVLAGSTAALVLLVAQGVAFGLMLLSTPVAVVTYLALPTAWTIVTVQVDALRAPAEWLDLNRTLMPLLAGDLTTASGARLAVSVALWVGVPLAIGLWRTGRRDAV